MTPNAELARALYSGLHSSSPYAETLTLTDAMASVAHGLHEVARALERLGERTPEPPPDAPPDPTAIERPRRQPSPDAPPNAWTARGGR
jgi:hypothetical protein